MPNRFPLSALKPGYKLKVALYHDGGLLLAESTVVSERHLTQLTSWDIEEVETEKNFTTLSEVIEVPGDGEEAEEFLDLEELGIAPKEETTLPAGRDSDDGKTYLIDGPLEKSDKPIRISKDAVVEGDVSSGVELDVEGSLKIDGSVMAGCRIAGTGEVNVVGTVAGTEELPVTIEGASLVLCEVKYAKLTARQNIFADSLTYCESSAGSAVTITGSEKGIIGGTTEAGVSIQTTIASGKGDNPAILRVHQNRQKQLFLSVSRIENGLKAKAEEHARLEKTIEVVKLLGEKVVSLPPEKKQELALQSRRYMEIKKEIADLKSAQERVQEELNVEIRTFSDCPMQIGAMFPAIEVQIRSASLQINNRQTATGYYLKNGRIMAHSRSE